MAIARISIRQKLLLKVNKKRINVFIISRIMKYRT